MEVSLIIPTTWFNSSLRKTVTNALQFFDSHFTGGYEVIVVPNGPAIDDESTNWWKNSIAAMEHVRVAPRITKAGKGIAIREGILLSRGEKLFFTDADLPYDLSFFTEAYGQLEKGVSLVTGNRRLQGSYFDVSLSVLHLAYRRHRLGLWFNRLVRWLLPIRSLDTQAGIKAISRHLALLFVERQTCPGFLFDIELFLTADGHDLSHVELPVRVHLESEKSTVRIWKEIFSCFYWLAVFKRRFERGYYSSKKVSETMTISEMAVPTHERARPKNYG